MDNSKAQKKVCQARFPMPHFGRYVMWIGILCFMFASAVLARENNWQLTLANGDKISSVSLQRLEGDSLAISSAFSDTTFMKWISVESIVELRKVKKSKFWKGAGIGFVAGAAAGALIGWATYEEPEPTPGGWDINWWTSDSNASVGAILFAPVGFLLGGIIGSSAGKDQTYDFTQMKYKQKLDLISSLVSNQN